MGIDIKLLLKKDKIVLPDFLVSDFKKNCHTINLLSNYSSEYEINTGGYIVESTFNNKPYCKISEMLGMKQPKEVIEINGVIVSVEGELNIKKLVKKAVSL